MTYDEITLFGRFLQDKSMQKNYAWFYDSHRFDRRSLDTFLEQVAAEDAILSAFDLAGAPNTIFNPKYWQTLNDKWMKRLKDFRDAGSSLEADLIRCEHCGRMMPHSSFALNAKGQLHKYCRECESGEWDRKRKELEAETKEKEKQEKAIKVLEKEIAEKQAKLDRLSAGRDAAAGDTASPEGAGATDVRQEEQADEAKYSPKLGEHDATLHYKPETKKIVLNAVLSAYLYTSGLTKCYLETKRDGRQFLIFNNSEGANVTWITTKSSRLAQVCSTANCRQIADHFNLRLGELYYLHVTKNLSKLQDTINIEIKQVHSREEFAAIAARREEEQKAGRPVPGEDVPEYETPDTAEDTADTPLLDFSGETEQQAEPKKANVRMVTKTPSAKDDGQSLIPLTGLKPAGLLQQLIEKGHLTERDIAKFLYDRGWKLQEPVVVTTHKKFKA